MQREPLKGRKRSQKWLKIREVGANDAARLSDTRDSARLCLELPYRGFLPTKKKKSQIRVGKHILLLSCKSRGDVLCTSLSKVRQKVSNS